MRARLAIIVPIFPLAIDDTPTARYGPKVQGAGIHHNPTPGEERRPSHADKRKALQRLILREEIRAAAGCRVESEEFSDWAIRLLDLAA